MKHGHHLPADKRDDMARHALSLFEQAGSRTLGLAAVENFFDVSNPTARNLVGRGRYLREELPRAS